MDSLVGDNYDYVNLQLMLENDSMLYQAVMHYELDQNGGTLNLISMTDLIKGFLLRNKIQIPNSFWECHFHQALAVECTNLWWSPTTLKFQSKSAQLAHKKYLAYVREEKGGIVTQETKDKEWLEMVETRILRDPFTLDKLLNKDNKNKISSIISAYCQKEKLPWVRRYLYLLLVSNIKEKLNELFGSKGRELKGLRWLRATTASLTQNKIYYYVGGFLISDKGMTFYGEVSNISWEKIYDLNDVIEKNTEGAKRNTVDINNLTNEITKVEEKMTTQTIKMKNHMFINDIDVSEASVPYMLKLITGAEAEIDELNKLKTKPKVVQQTIKMRKDEIKALVAWMDNQFEAKNT